MRISEKTYTKYNAMYVADRKDFILDVIKNMSHDEIANYIIDIEWAYAKSTYTNAMRKAEKTIAS